jgi:hypothetical protein
MTIQIGGAGGSSGGGVWGPPSVSGIVFANQYGSDSLSGDTPANAKATLAGALAALPSLGGKVSVGHGGIAAGSGTTIALPAGITIEGQNLYHSYIQWATDLGTNVPGLACTNDTSGPSHIRDIQLVGPALGDAPSPGVQPPVTMWGILTGSHARLQNVYATGFHDNICIGADHETLISCKAQGGWSNLLWANTGNKGNQTLIGLDLYTAALASVRVLDGGAIYSTVADQVDTGQAPFGVYIEPRSSGSGSWLTDSTFRYFGFEYCGNELVHDATLGGVDNPGMANVEWFTGPWSWNYPTGYASAYPSVAAFYTTTDGHCVFKDFGGGGAPPGPGSLGVFGSYLGVPAGNEPVVGIGWNPASAVVVAP